MKVAVYTIALNEEQFVARWRQSANDADYCLVVDTGSTDSTVAQLTDLGVPHQQIFVRPFRFDDARNAALALLPDDIDVAIALDMDEVLTEGWRTHLERCWHGTRLHYGYVWSWTDDGRPARTFLSDKIVGRHSHRWTHPIHEVLVPTVPEIVCVCEPVLIEHRPNADKSRGQYLDLLILAVAEDPQDDRNAHYLGREYYFHQRYIEAIAQFTRHLALPRAVWRTERASSMRHIAKCYQALGDLKLAHRWFVQATLEDDESREALIDAANFLLSQGAFHATIHFCERALAITPTLSYTAEYYANNEGPYDLAAIAHFYLGHQQEAIALALQALQFNLNDPRLQNNLRMMQ